MGFLRRVAAALTADRVAALLFLAVFAAYGISGSHISAALDSDVVGPGFFPAIIAVLGTVLALVMLFRPDGGGRKPLLAFDPMAFVPVGLLLVYVLALEYIGFTIATVAFLAVAFRYLGCAGWVRSAAYSLLATAALVGLFRHGLELWLPRGTLITLF